MSSKRNAYSDIILAIFQKKYKKGSRSFEFTREEIVTTAKDLGRSLPKNLGDLIYSFRFRASFPEEINSTAPHGYTWQIELAGKSKKTVLYRFSLSRQSKISPREDAARIKIPDSTPEIIAKYAQTDEQALLAKVRYNRLIDIFLGITTYSLQNHMRTSVSDMGQIEIDEIYVGVNKTGAHFIVPVQAKSGSDQIGSVQAKQDIKCCAEKFPDLTCRPVSVQFLSDGSIAMFELTMEDSDIKVVEERHYQLVPSSTISQSDLMKYRRGV